jgi:hypothetical protein
MLFPLELGKPDPDRLGTTIASRFNLKFHFLPFSKGIIVHPFKLLAVEEEVFPLLSLDKPEATI